MGKLQKDFRFEIDTLGRMCVRARNEALASDVRVRVRERATHNGNILIIQNS